MSTISDALKDSRTSELLVELTYGTNAVRRLATRTITVPSSTGAPRLFQARLTAPLELGSSFDTRSFTYSIPTMPVELQNESRLQDMEKLVSIDQISAKVYLWAPGLTWEDIETNGVLFSGAFVKRYHTLDRYVFDIEDIQYTKFKTIPRAVIDSTAWPNHRSSTPGTPCSGKWVPLVFGDWTVSRGAKLPMWCIDTVNGIYVACFGTPKSVDADFDADTDCRIWEADGDKIAAANYAWALRTDGRGHQMTGPDFSVEENTNETLTCAMEGYVDSSGLITGTAGTLLEHPAHIAYYLMRYESLLANAELHIQSLKACASLLPGLKYAVYVSEAVNCGDIIDRMLSQCNVARTQIQGKVGLVTIVTDASSLTNIKTISQIRRSVQVQKTPIDDVVNSLSIQYAYNPAESTYGGTLLRNKTNNDACNESANLYGERSQLILEWPDVADSATASALAARLLSLKSQRHDIVTMEVPYWIGWDLQEGDAASIDLREGPSLDGNGWVDEPMILLERQFLENTIRQTWWRIATG